MKARLEFKPADLWVGVYLERKLRLTAGYTWTELHAWITIVPMFPLHISFKLPN